MVSGTNPTRCEQYVEYIDKWFLVSSFSAGGGSKFATLFTDITAAKLFEQQLELMVSERAESLQRSLEDLEIANRVKDDFLASMSHELRTPLNSILGFSGILLGEMAGPLTAEQRKQLAIIRESGERLLVLVNDLLDLTRIEQGRVEVTIEEFDLVALVQTMVDMVRPMADAKSLPMRVESNVPWISVWTDRDRVGQIVLNLLSNAVKYTDAGSVIVRVEMTRDGMNANIMVSDTGCGVDPDEIEAIFDRFRAVRGLVRRTTDGAGLGLSISKRLATLLGGTITVDSATGKGSTFALRIPVRHADARL
ncbi:MAG: sensor histidine kinase [Coriobacteriia bacterium]